MPKKVTCPNATFESIKTILFALKFKNRLSINEMLYRINRSLSWLNNATPIMAEMGLIYRGFEEFIGITNKGKELIVLIENNNKKELKKFGEEIYQKSEILRITKNILDEKPNIKLAELGKKIADGLDIPEEERWKNKTTYVVVARSCLSILSGLKLIDYKKMKYTRSNINRFQNKIMPYASTIIIDKKLQEFIKNNEGLYELNLDTDKFTQYQRQRQTDYLNTMIMLGMIERIEGKEYRYKLTEEGLWLKNARDFTEHAQIFQEILLKNPHVVEIIKTIRNNYDEIRSEEIGSILSEYNKANWGDGTKKSYGNNFMNWLLEADIMVKRGRKHKHTFQPHFLESENYKKYIENKTDIIINANNKKIQSDLKIIEPQKNQTIKLVHKTKSLDGLDYFGLLEKVIVEISLISCDTVDDWNSYTYVSNIIVEIYERLMETTNDYKLLSVALSNFIKGYNNRDIELINNAQKINTVLLGKDR